MTDIEQENNKRFAYNLDELSGSLWEGFTLLENYIHENISDENRILDDDARCVHSMVLGHIGKALMYASALEKWKKV